ncbi:hypothetical protein MXB_4620, partial [Myxobolus squamalis]
SIETILRLVILEHYFPENLQKASCTCTVCFLSFSVKPYPSYTVSIFLPAQQAVLHFKISAILPPKSFPFCLQ